MTLQERFAANLRALRECYGETQEDLALALHLSKTAVSNYECGARMPGSDILLALAEHFMIPVDDLLQQELSAALRVEPDAKLMPRSIPVLLPLVSSKEALQDPHFREALRAHRALYSALTDRPQDSDPDDLFRAQEGYTRCADGPAAGEAAAGRLALLFLQFLLLDTSPEILLTDSAPLQCMRSSDRDFDDTVQRYREENDPQFERERRAYAREMQGPEAQKEIVELLQILREEPRLRSYADYYMALRYLLGLNGKGLSRERSMQIGTELLQDLAALGDPLSRRLLRFMRRSWPVRRRG